MPAEKGTRPPNAGKGRAKGVPNKLTRTVKECFEQVFKDLQADPKKPYALGRWAQDNPTEFYKIGSKLIPAEIKGQMDHTHKLPSVAVVASALGIAPQSAIAPPADDGHTPRPNDTDK